MGDSPNGKGYLMRKLLSLRFIVFLALLPIALLLFWEGKRYEMGRSDGRFMKGGRCYTR